MPYYASPGTQVPADRADGRLPLNAAPTTIKEELPARMGGGELFPFPGIPKGEQRYRKEHSGFLLRG